MLLIYIVLEILIELSEGNRFIRDFFSLRAFFNVIVIYVMRGFLDYTVLIILRTDDIKKEGDLRFLVRIVFKKRIPRIFFY